MTGRRVFLSLSGGVDSTTLYALLLSKGMEVVPVFFRYPSKHNDMEMAAAARVAAHYEALGQKPLVTIDVRPLFTGIRSNLLVDGGDIPSNPYDKTTMAQTVVPGRNLIFASILAAHAQSVTSTEGDKSYVALGMHGGDHEIYPDCRPEFVTSLQNTIHLSSDGKVVVITPLVNLSKTDLVAMGLGLGAPYELTRSCYNGTDKPCGVCGTCRERQKAFADNGVKDPIEE